VEMKAQIVEDVPISITPIPSLLHQNNIGVTYVGPSNFIMEPIISMPLHFMVMPQSIIIAIETSFVSILIHTIDGVKSRPTNSKGNKIYEFA